MVVDHGATLSTNNDLIPTAPTWGSCQDIRGSNGHGLSIGYSNSNSNTYTYIHINKRKTHNSASSNFDSCIYISNSYISIYMD